LLVSSDELITLEKLALLMEKISNGFNLVLFCHSALKPITTATKDLFALARELFGPQNIRWIVTS
jgi:hypothetical protein